jgi:hypothetical protein
LLANRPTIEVFSKLGHDDFIKVNVALVQQELLTVPHLMMGKLSIFFSDGNVTTVTNPRMRTRMSNGSYNLVLEDFNDTSSCSLLPPRMVPSKPAFEYDFRSKLLS